MSSNSNHHELKSILELLDLGPGNYFLDAQSIADDLLFHVAERVAPYGAAIGMVYGERALGNIQKRLRGKKQEAKRIEIKLGHTSNLPFNQEQFSVVLYRNTRHVHNFQRVMQEAWRVSERNARIVVCHSYWEYELPANAPAEVKKALQDIQSPQFKNGVDFMEQFQSLPWRSVDFDVYTLVSNQDEHKLRYNGAWRTYLREILGGEKYYCPEDIQKIINYIEQNKVPMRADRYLGIGKSP
jgi:SAM-dependent methyltransferase